MRQLKKYELPTDQPTTIKLTLSCIYLSNWPSYSCVIHSISIQTVWVFAWKISTYQEPEDKQLFSNQILHFNKFSPHPEIPPLHPSIFSQDALSVRPNLVAMTMPPGEEEEDDDFKLKFSL